MIFSSNFDLLDVVKWHRHVVLGRSSLLATLVPLQFQSLATDRGEPINTAICNELACLGNMEVHLTHRSIGPGEKHMPGLITCSELCTTACKVKHAYVRSRRWSCMACEASQIISHHHNSKQRRRYVRQRASITWLRHARWSPAITRTKLIHVYGHVFSICDGSQHVAATFQPGRAWRQRRYLAPVYTGVSLSDTLTPCQPRDTTRIYEEKSAGLAR